VRFQTDATSIHVHYQLHKDRLSMPHMPATGVSGIDLYARNAALREAFATLRNEGVAHLHYIPGDALYGTDTEGATDASHASDLGFMRQADVMEPILRTALRR